MAMRRHGILNKFNLLGAAASVALLAGCATAPAEEAQADLVEAPVEATPQIPPYMDASLSPEARAKDLVSRMTLEEKASQMYDKAAAIPRLGIHEYNWWNEALHGVARAGHATMIPPVCTSRACGVELWVTKHHYAMHLITVRRSTSSVRCTVISIPAALAGSASSSSVSVSVVFVVGCMIQCWWIHHVWQC